MAEGTFRVHLKWKRQELRWTQKRLAKESGLTPEWINHFERGERIPSVPTLAALAKALGTTMDYLWGEM